MALRDIFKRKKSIPAAKTVEDKIEKKEVKKPAKIQKEAGEVKAEISKKAKKSFGTTFRALKAPHITEKATYLAEKNQYVFKVYPRTNKVEIRKDIEELYNVKVLDVKIINVPKKRRRVGKNLGWKKGYKKAIIKIKKGQKIEIIPS
ncbi:MAG: 50S ribosomal protein L23 [Patescibacteria group bacterium]|nr:50S ribosomal protein L23 [Patescibacteria group bacterium]